MESVPLFSSFLTAVQNTYSGVDLKEDTAQLDFQVYIVNERKFSLFLHVTLHMANPQSGREGGLLLLHTVNAACSCLCVYRLHILFSPNIQAAQTGYAQSNIS